jgi:hypothetical protein
MTKQSGMGDNLYVGGYDLSGDTGSLGAIGGGNTPIVVTGIDKSGIERLGGKRDGRIEWSSYFNPSASQAHPVLSALPTADVHVMYCRGTTLGSPAASQVSKQVNYDGTRTSEGGFTFALQALANAYGLEWGVLLTAGKRSDTTATNGTGVDTGASALFGWQAYMQAFSFTGTSVTIQIQDSADNVSFANLGAGGAFTAVTAAQTVQRLASPGATDTVRQYVRIATSGTFSQCTFAVAFVKNISATVF